VLAAPDRATISALDPADEYIDVALLKIEAAKRLHQGAQWWNLAIFKGNSLARSVSGSSSDAGGTPKRSGGTPRGTELRNTDLIPLRECTGNSGSDNTLTLVVKGEVELKHKDTRPSDLWGRFEQWRSTVERGPGENPAQVMIMGGGSATFGLLVDDNTESLEKLLEHWREVVLLKLTVRHVLIADLLPMFKWLGSNRTVLTLNIRDTVDPSSAGVCSVAEALTTNSTLTDLTIRDSCCTDEGVRALANALRVNCGLKSLDLGASTVGSAGASYLAEVLPFNTALTSLDISGNSIACIGAQHLATALERGGALIHLDLRQNGIVEEGARYLAEALKVNTTLKTLKLCGNILTDEGVRHMAEALGLNKGLDKLFLREAKVGDEGAKFLAAALVGNSTLSELDIANNVIADPAVQHFAQALGENHSLKRLIFRGNMITDEGAPVIASAVAANLALTLLDVTYNRITTQCARDLDCERVWMGMRTC